MTAKRPANDSGGAAPDAVAIIGIGCRFPGGANNPETFWELLISGFDAVSEVPDNRVDVAAAYDPDPTTAGKVCTRYGAFLEDIEYFDAELFGISPREAIHIDPQQRLMLEVAWEAFEDAGLPIADLRGSDTGVFLGLMSGDYEALLFEQSESLKIYTLNGASRYGLAGRISFCFGLEGPSLVVDTSCSSSLMAVHLACQSLRSGDCELAIAGGVHLILKPQFSIALSQGGLLAVDGRCKFADASADGFGRGEGVGAAVLKPVERALADGDRIYALIRGGATTNDGRSNEAMAAPSRIAQETLLRRSFRRARVSVEEIQYIEAHGTGTPAGDLAELTALGAIFAHRCGPPCSVGSVKTNIGHTLGASGIGGLIKLALCLKHRYIPASLHFRTPNPNLCWDELNLRIQDVPTPWPNVTGTAAGGVSSFGLSGSSVHLLLEEAPRFSVCAEAEPTVANGKEAARYLLTLSARTEPALRELAQRYQTFASALPESRLADICFTASTGRSHFDHRLAVIADSTPELAERLRGWQAERESSDVISGKSDIPPHIVFLFTGQGSQYVGMGRKLYERESGFRRTLDRCAEILRSELEVPLLDVLYYDESKGSLLYETVYTQPVLFALEYALAKLWISWGIEPAALAGHSVGEYVAACLASVFNLEDGLRLIAERARLMHELPREGKMAVVYAAEERVSDTIRPYRHEISIAAVNGPDNIVISGRTQAVEDVLAAFEKEGIETRKLKVSHAFHSHLMEPMLPGFEQVAKEIPFSSPRIDLISNLTGELVTGEAMRAEYWCRHVREPVRFSRSIATLHRQGCEVFLEIGPRPTLLGMGRRCLPEGLGIWLPSLRRDRDDWQQMWQSLAQLYVCGTTVDWASFHRNYPCRRLALPNYPFQRQRFWMEPARRAAAARWSDQRSEQLTYATVPDYYDALSESMVKDDSQGYHLEERFLTFGPFSEIKTDFSWVRVLFSCPHKDEEGFQLTLSAQKELRRALFSNVDFLSCSKVLDFGCGYGADLIALAEKYEHLQLVGCTISQKQKEIATSKVASRGLDDRIRTYCRDSSQYEFQERYDLAFGIEVAHYIRDKDALFLNLSRHLEDGGFLVLADFIASGTSPVEHYETSSYFSTKEHWVDFLSRNHLVIVKGIDVSGEIANFLYDPDFENNLKMLDHIDQQDAMIAHYQSYNQLGKLLRKRLARYVLLTIQKKGRQAEDEIRRGNREAIDALKPYSDVQVDKWLYEVVWQASATVAPKLPVRRDSEDPGCWLIFSDREGVGETLAELLENRGARCVLIYAGERYEELEGRRFRIDPRDAVSFQRLLVEAMPGARLPFQGIVHLWSLEAGRSNDLTISSLEAAQALGVGSVLHLIQALALMKRPGSPQLWLVTRGVRSVGQQPAAVEVAQAPLWGLGEVIVLEHPELRCVRLDLDPAASEAEARALFSELWSPDGNGQVALRGETRYVARLGRFSDQASGKQPSISGDRTYLISGGLGALGLEVARWLVEKGAQYLVLCGRSGVSIATQDVLGQLKKQGARVLVSQTDVVNQQDVRRLLDTVQATLPPLRGIVHAAGMVEDGVLLQLGWESCRRVMAPKVEGAWNLHVLTRDMPLDFFVFFSSVASLLGSAGQGNYAAANAFMDALADHRQAQGLPALSIQWGPWTGFGMARESRAERLAAERGLGTMEPEQALKTLGDLLTQSSPRVGVFPIHWPQFFSRQSTRSGPFHFFSRFQQALDLERPKSGEPGLRERLAEALPGERPQLLLAHIQDVVARILGFERCRHLDPQRGFFDMGMDSLMAVELRHRLETDLGTSLPSTIAFKYSNIQDLCEYLLHELAKQDPPAGTGTVLKETRFEQDAISGEIDKLSDEDVEAAILENMQSLTAMLGEAE